MSLEPDPATINKTDQIAVEVASLEVTGMYAGAATAVVGAFLPWYTLLGVSVIGIEGDGILTLVLGVAAAGSVWYLADLRARAIASMAFGGLIALMAVFHLSTISDTGVYLTLLGGVGLVGAGCSAYRKG